MTFFWLHISSETFWNRWGNVRQFKGEIWLRLCCLFLHMYNVWTFSLCLAGREYSATDLAAFPQAAFIPIITHIFFYFPPVQDKMRIISCILHTTVIHGYSHQGYFCGQLGTRYADVVPMSTLTMPMEHHVHFYLF